MKRFSPLVILIIFFLISISCSSASGIKSFFVPIKWNGITIGNIDQSCEELTIILNRGGDHSHVYVDDIKFSCLIKTGRTSFHSDYICVGSSSSIQPTLTVKIYEYSSLDSLKRSISIPNQRPWDVCDYDGDGAMDAEDSCLDDPEIWVCACDVGDGDADGDGVLNCNDTCQDDPDKVEPGRCGCGVSDLDADQDGLPDCLDECPADPDKEAPENCGCGIAETDTDGDWVPDCIDTCPEDPEKDAPGMCGCGVSDSDEDEDGLIPCEDICPGDAWHDAVGDPCDHDEDNDGTTDDADGCPFDSKKTKPGSCGCGVPDPC